MRDYLPAVLATEILENTTLIQQMCPCFMDKKKYSKTRAHKSLVSSVPSDILDKVSPVKIELKNTGFKLEILDGLRLVIHHPDLPPLDYNLVYNIVWDNFYRVWDIIYRTKGVKNNLLVGSYCFDPCIGTFILEDNNPELIKKASIGKIIVSSKKKKLVPGHKYYIEIGPGMLCLKEVIFLGFLDGVNIEASHGSWRSYDYETCYPSEFSISMEYRRVKCVDRAYLFKDLGKEGDNYFICSKAEIKGVDLGDTGETMTEADFYDLALKNKWILEIDRWDKFKEIYVEELIKFLDERMSGSVLDESPYNKNKIDFSKTTCSDALKFFHNCFKCKSHYCGNHTPFTRLIDPDDFHQGEDRLLEILELIYEHYGWNKS